MEDNKWTDDQYKAMNVYRAQLHKATLVQFEQIEDTIEALNFLSQCAFIDRVFWEVVQKGE